MSELPIAERPVFERLHQLVRDHNDGQTSCKYKIRNGVKNTLLAIMNEYIKEFRKVEKAGFMADSDQLPSLHTNRYALAALTSSGKRTIYDHIMLLIETGFLAKETHGWQRNFEVWINPWILFGDNFSRPAIIDHYYQLDQKNASGDPHKRQSSPPKSILETSNNCLIGGVDLSKTSVVDEKRSTPTNPRSFKDIADNILERAGERTTVNAPETLESAPGGGGQGGQHTPLRVEDKGGQRAGNGLDVTNQKPAGSVPTTPKNPALREYQKNRVLSFWQLAKEKLWFDNTFSADHTSNILNLIWRDVFWGWDGATTIESCSSLYMSRIQQLEKAERYIRKQKWTSVIPPLKYFSLRFHKEQLAKGEKGNFHFTTAWQLADEQAREKLQQDNLLHKAVRSVLDGITPKGKKGAASMSKLQLYQYWQEKLHRQSTPETVVRFNQQVASMFNVNPVLKQLINNLQA